MKKFSRIASLVAVIALLSTACSSKAGEATPEVTPSSITNGTNATVNETPDPANVTEMDCTPGYDPCLPPASDYDCAGGSGNGPMYTGLVIVTGSDVYDLDRDGNGVGCEN